jgi:hypothetical protein
MKSRRWGPWRQEWYSIYSDPTREFEVGSWRNVWIGKLSAFTFERWPDFWRWWNNLPIIRQRWLRGLQKHFPNLH